MPNGGYPIWMQLNLTHEYALRLKAREVWVVKKVVTTERDRWENVHQVPPQAIAALIYHLAYWGMSGGSTSLRESTFDDKRIEPWRSTNGWCLYDY